MRSRLSRRRAAAAAAGAVLTALLACLLGGCGSSTTTPAPAPLVSTPARLEDGKVVWTTDQPTRGSVRYGFVSGAQDRLAYPAAAGGGDKEYTAAHAVPLLELPPGVDIYIRRADLTADGRLHVAPEETLRAPAGAAEAAAALLRFTSIDVQFGDAHVLQLPSSGGVVVIDAGDPGAGRRGETAPAHVRRWLQDRGVAHLDFALATHVHADHIGGFVTGGDGGPGLVGAFTIGAYLDVPAVSRPRNYYTQLLGLLAAAEVPRLVIAPGMTDKSDPAALAWDPLVEVAVLNAGSQPEWSAPDVYDGDALNNDSVVLKITYGDVDIVTGGDCEVPGETRILTHFAPALAGVEYFKASHHGRYDANSVAYLQAMSPRAALIPVAFVAYNEGPQQGARDSEQTLGRLAALRVDVFRFDAAAPLDRAQDNVTFWHTTMVTDGSSYEVRIAPSLWGP